jgi:hypothetical protein
MFYYIHKISRLPTSPYSGPTCERAGVKPGKIYTDYNEALIDAKKLSAVNPVGFSVTNTVENPIKGYLNEE